MTTPSAGPVEVPARATLGSSVVLVFTLVGYPIVAMVADTLALPNRATSIAYRSLLLVVVVATIYRHRTQLLRVSWRSSALFALLFWAVYLPRMAVYVMDTSWSPRLPRPEYFTWAIGVALLPGLACAAAEKFHASIPRVLIVGGCVVLAYAAMQAPTTATDYAVSGLDLPTLNRTTIGVVGADVALMALWVLVTPSGGAGRLLFVIAGIGMGFASIVLSGARAPFIEFMGAGALLIGARVLKSRGVSRFAFAVFLALAVVSAPRVLSSVEDALGTNFLRARLGESEDTGDEARLYFLAGAQSAFLANPLFGSALDEPNTGEYPHNLIAESFMSGGLLAGIPFTIFFIGSLAGAVRLVLSGQREAWVGLLSIQASVSAAVSGSLYYSDAFWCFAFAVCAVRVASSLNRRARDTDPQPGGSAPQPV